MVRRMWGLTVPIAAATLGGCFTTPDGAVREDVSTQLRLAAGESTIEFHTPDGASVSDVVVGAMSMVDIRDRAQVDGDMVSKDRIRIGNDAKVKGTSSAKGNIYVGHRSKTGDLYAGGSIKVEPSATTGSSNAGHSMSDDGHFDLHYDIPSSSYGKRGPSTGERATSLVPGRYGHVNLNSGAKLTLSSGVYFVGLVSTTTLALAWCSTTSTAPSRCMWPATWRRGVHGPDSYSDSHAELLVVYAGKGTVVFESQFDGFLWLPPTETVRMAGNNKEHRGLLLRQEGDHLPDGHGGSSGVRSRPLRGARAARVRAGRHQQRPEPRRQQVSSRTGPSWSSSARPCSGTSRSA